MSILLTATIVAALIALGAYVNVASQRDHLERRVAELECQLRSALERYYDSLS